METSSISSTLDTCEKMDNSVKISKFRNYASQIYAALATSIVKLTVGMTIGFRTVLIGELYKDNAGIKMSLNDLSLFSSSCFLEPLSGLILGTVAQRISTRATMLISVTIYAISILIFYFATNSSMLLGAQALGGIVSMTAIGPAITYVVETTQPQLRSILTASTSLATIFGAFLIVLLSNFLHWRVLVLIMLIFPVTGFVAVYTIPETPHWLASKKKFDKAESALCWLRGWSTSENIAPEFSALKNTYTKSSDNVSSPSRRVSFKDNISTYMHRSFYVPLSLICSLFILYQCTGQSPLRYYSIVIFSQINAPMDPLVAASVVDAMQILGAIVFILSINHTGKKKLMYISLIGVIATFFTSSAALLLKEYQIFSGACQWIAALAMMLSTFLTSAGIEKIVYILNAELFPTKYRNVGMGIGLVIYSVAGAIMNEMFFSLVDVIELPGVFLFFGISSVVTCIVFHFAFPETEGKTLQEIEAHYGRNKRLKKQQKLGNISAEASHI